jgi:hypothetical protein
MLARALGAFGGCREDTVALTIQTTRELETWLQAEASLMGLDAAMFARVVLFKAMNGAGRPLAAPPVPAANYGPREPAVGPDSGEHVWMEPDEAIDESELYEIEEVEIDEAPAASTQTIDIEAIVAQRLAEELAKRPVATSYDEADLVVRAVRRGQMPAYGNTSPRIQRIAVGPTG